MRESTEDIDPNDVLVRRAEWEAVAEAIAHVVELTTALSARPAARSEADHIEVAKLETRFRKRRSRLMWLAVLAVAAVAILWAVWLDTDPGEAASRELVLLVLSVAAGVAGSAVAALQSLLDRHAQGFELADGRLSPVSQRTDRYSTRMEPWFTARPVLGAFAGLVAFAGSGYLNFVAEEPPGGVAFLALLAGLFAKTLVERLKKIFETILGG